MKGLSRLAFLGGVGIIAATWLAWGHPFAAAAQTMPSSQGFAITTGVPDPALGAEEGAQIFAAKCAACHGAQRNAMPNADLSSQKYLADRGDATLADIITKGKGGMPPFGSSLSQDEIKAIVAYLNAAAAGTLAGKDKNAAGTPDNVSPATLTLKATNGAPIHVDLEAVLKDAQNKPIARAPITFTSLTDFMAASRSPNAGMATMKLGESETDANGVAHLRFEPHQAGDVKLAASYAGSAGNGAAEASTMLAITPGEEAGYTTHVGIRPEVPLQLTQAVPSAQLESAAPQQVGGFYFPLSASWGLALLLAGLWSAYYVVAYQIMGIGLVAPVGSVLDRRLVPFVMAAVVVALGATLIWVVLTSPYTHLHLGPPPVPWPAMEDTHPR